MVEFLPYDCRDHRDDRHDARHDPLTPERHANFDWPQIFRNLDGEQADSGMIPREAAASALAALLVWVCDGSTGSTVPPQALPGIARRAIAALHVVSPGTFSGTPAQRELCARFRMSHAWLSAPVSEFTRRFGIQNRFQQHGRGGTHAKKLRVEFAPPVAFPVPVQHSPAPVEPSEGADPAKTPSAVSDAPQPKEATL